MAVFSTIGSVINANSQRKAATQAAQTVSDTSERNNALAREIYQTNQGYLAPYAQRGNPAGDQINALLGLGGGAQPQTAGFSYNEVPMAGDAMANPRAYGAGQSPTAQGGNPQQNAFDMFRNSTGYQFRLGEGMNALNSGYAAAGTLQSGAAMRDAVRYGQDFASNEFGNYMGYLSNQQGAGLAGASALAGVGSAYTGQVSANNNNAASAIANSQLARGANNPWGNALMGIGQAGQQAAGAFLGGGFG